MIYFIQAGNDGPIKIGKTNNIKQRLAELQTGSPAKLKLLATFNGGQSIEIGLHNHFAKYRIDGEWFDPHPDILKCVETETLPVMPKAPRETRNEKILKLVFLDRKNDSIPLEVITDELQDYLNKITKLCAKSIKNNKRKFSLDIPSKIIETQRALAISWAVMGLLGIHASRIGDNELATEFNGICSALARINKELDKLEKK